MPSPYAHLYDVWAELYEGDETVSVNSLARRYNCSRAAVTKGLKKRGIAITNKKGKRGQNTSPFEEHYDEWVRLYTEELRTMAAIAERFNTSPNSVAVGLRKRGIEPELARSPYAQHYHEWAKMYQSDTSVEDIADCFGCEATAIYKGLHYLDVTLTGSTKSWTCNSTAFSNINSDLAAYWLGLIAADGYLYEPEQRIAIGLHKEDGFLLNEFLRFINYMGETTPIYEKKGEDGMIVQLRDEGLFSDLQHYGLEQAKSLTLQWPENVDPKWHASYVRGLFDGDGYIGVRDRGKKGVAAVLEWISGSWDLITRLEEVIRVEVGVNPQKIRKRLYEPTGHYTYSLRYNGNRQIRRIEEWMYQDAALWIPRKRNRFIWAHPKLRPNISELSKY